ncbi:MAG: EAL domain-containing protein [Wenzhouxiangellaceae bacterium]
MVPKGAKSDMRRPVQNPILPRNVIRGNAVQTGEIAPSRLTEGLRRLFLLIALIGGAILAWFLLDQWRDITERHELRQRSQIVTIAGATRKIIAAQELVLDIVGAELYELIDAGDEAGCRAELDRLRSLNPVVAAYALLSTDGRVLLTHADLEQTLAGNPHRLTEHLSSDALTDALADNRLVLGRSYRLPGSGERVIPGLKAIRDESGQAQLVIVAALRLGGPQPLFESSVFLGPRNTLQIVRGRDLFPLHWSAPFDPPAGYYEHPIPRQYYDDAVASAEALSGQPIERIKAESIPVPYRVVNALGPHLGYAVFDPEHDFWVITQTHRNQLVAEFMPVALASTAIYLLLIALMLVMLPVIARTEAQRQHELEHRARHDLLTGLANRLQVGHDFAALSQRHQGQVAMLYVDLNKFKSFNDSFGHWLGDALLGELGRRLQRGVSGQERVARVGGDEFVVLCPADDRSVLEARAKVLVELISAPFDFEGLQCQIGCSIGIARTIEAGPELDDLLRAADVAMYEAKHRHEEVCFYKPELAARYLHNLAIERRLKEAMKDGRIQLHYQPLVDARGAVLGFEALARWRDAELGEVPPERFIAVAEATGSMAQLGDYILARVLSDARRLEQSIRRPFKLSINVSVSQFRTADFAARMIERVNGAGLEHAQLVVEITESLFMEDHERVVDTLKSLRDQGVGVSLDDFGTGYSSLGLLRVLPLDEIKIDRSFVRDVDGDLHTRTLIRGIIALARSHGIRVLAEGVETRRQLELLTEYGCEAFQGFLFAAPMSIIELEQYLSDDAATVFAPA